MKSLSRDKYRAHPALNFSSAKHLLASPAHYRAALEEPVVETDAMRLGTLVHAMALEGADPADLYAIRPHGMLFTTKEGRAWRDEQILPIIGQDDVETARRMVDAIHSNQDAVALLDRAKEREVPALAELDGVDCKGLFDALGCHNGTWAIVDLKTTQDASAEGFVKAIVRGHYDMQAAWYSMLLGAAMQLEEAPEFFWIAVEKTAPYVCHVYQIDDLWMDAGISKVELALERFKKATETGDWWKPYEGIRVLSKPNWA